MQSDINEFFQKSPIGTREESGRIQFRDEVPRIQALPSSSHIKHSRLKGSKTCTAQSLDLNGRGWRACPPFVKSSPHSRLSDTNVAQLSPSAHLASSSHKAKAFNTLLQRQSHAIARLCRIKEKFNRSRRHNNFLNASKDCRKSTFSKTSLDSPAAPDRGNHLRAVHLSFGHNPTDVVKQRLKQSESIESRGEARVNDKINYMLCQSQNSRALPKLSQGNYHTLEASIVRNRPERNFFGQQSRITAQASKQLALKTYLQKNKVTVHRLPKHSPQQSSMQIQVGGFSKVKQQATAPDRSSDGRLFASKLTFSDSPNKASQRYSESQCQPKAPAEGFAPDVLPNSQCKGQRALRLKTTEGGARPIRKILDQSVQIQSQPQQEHSVKPAQADTDSQKTGSPRKHYVPQLLTKSQVITNLSSLRDANHRCQESKRLPIQIEKNSQEKASQDCISQSKKNHDLLMIQDQKSAAVRIAESQNLEIYNCAGAGNTQMQSNSGELRGADGQKLDQRYGEIMSYINKSRKSEQNTYKKTRHNIQKNLSEKDYWPQGIRHPRDFRKFYMANDLKFCGFKAESDLRKSEVCHAGYRS